MAYRKHEQAIVPGSLNLLAPGDKSADGDCLQLTNWRVDQAGQLVQRWGWSTLNPAQLSLYRLNRVAQVDSRIYFSGNGKVYQLGDIDPGGTDGEIDGGYTGGPVSIVSFQGLAWIMNNAAGKQRVDDGTYTRNWTPETPGTPTLAAAAAGGAALEPGDWEYYVTFQTAEGHEGNPSPVQTVTVAAGERVAITRPARVENMSKHDNTTSPAITGWNVYRTGPGLGEVYRVNTNVIPYATNPYNDYGAASGGTETAQTNEDLQDRNIILEFDHNAAPAAVGAIGTYDGRIIAFRTTANPNRLFWTRPNEPWYFPTANYADIGALNDTIMAVSVKPNQVIIYKQKSIWRIVGELGIGRIEQVSTDVGCIGINAIARSSSGDYIVGKEGVYRWNGESARKVSRKLDPLFADQDVTIANGITYERINGNLSNCALGIRNGRLYFSYPTGGATYPTDGGRTLVMDIDTGRWVDWETAWNDYLDQGQNETLLGAGDQVIGTLETGYADDSAGGGLTNYDCIYHSRYEDHGAPDREKTWADLVIEHNTRNQAMTVSVWADNGTDSADESILGSISSTTRQKTILRVLTSGGLPVRGFNLAVRIEGTTNTAQTAPIEIYSVFLHAYIEATQAKTFDTDETSLGIQGIKELKAVELDMQYFGNSSLELRSDYPGTVQQIKNFAGWAGSFPFAGPSAGRVVSRIPMDQYTYGNLFRVILTATTSYFQIYALRMQIRRIGVFIEAYESGIGGYWWSDHQDFGTAQVKAARNLELDIDTSGSCTYSLTADMPGNVMVVRATGTVNTETTTTRRRIVRIPVFNVEGRHFALRLSAASQEIVLYGARLEVKKYGVYVENYEGQLGFVWDSDLLDFGIQDVKEAVEIQLDIDTDGTTGVNVYTDLPGQALAVRYSVAFDTSTTTTGRRMVNLPFTAAQGHYFQVRVNSLATFRLYGMRLRIRPYYFYIEASTAAAGAIYDSTELTFGTADPKEFDSIVVSYDGGPLTATLYTDLPGDAMTPRVTYTVPAAAGRRTATIPLNQVKGRLCRLTLSCSTAFRLYSAVARWRPIAVYLNASNSESYRTRDMDFGSEAVKMFGEFEADVELSGSATLNAYAEQPGGVPALATSFTLTGSGPRQVIKCNPGPYVKGRLLRLEVAAGSAAVTVHALRVYLKGMGQRGPTEWVWVDVPMPTTPPTYTESPLPVRATPETWEWVDVPLEKTATEWAWVDFPVPETPSEFQWVEVPVEQ